MNLESRGSAESEVTRAYERQVELGRAAGFTLGVSAHVGGAQNNATVHLFLDDSANGLFGLGNTHFVRLNKAEHSDGKGNLCMHDFKWYMMGAVKPCSVHSLNSGEECSCTDTCTPFLMPDAGKVVVTAEVNGKHAVVGQSPCPSLPPSIIHSPVA